MILTQFTACTTYTRLLEVELPKRNNESNKSAIEVTETVDADMIYIWNDCHVIN